MTAEFGEQTSGTTATEALSGAAVQTTTPARGPEEAGTSRPWYWWPTLALFVLLDMCGCAKEEPGTVGAPCKPDGTCLGKMECNSVNGHCYAPSPPSPPRRDFCEACIAQCGGDGGFRRCEVGDPSTWGGKPSVCECR